MDLGCKIPTMVSPDHTGMTRALLTDGERRHISGESGNEQRKYESVSRVRSRIEQELTSDIEILEEHHPELLEELREVVCETKGRATEN